MKIEPTAKMLLLLAAVIVFILGAVLTPGQNDLDNPLFMALAGLALFAGAFLAP